MCLLNKPYTHRLSPNCANFKHSPFPSVRRLLTGLKNPMHAANGALYVGGPQYKMRYLWALSTRYKHVEAIYL